MQDFAYLKSFLNDSIPQRARASCATMPCVMPTFGETDPSVQGSIALGGVALRWWGVWLVEVPPPATLHLVPQLGEVQAACQAARAAAQQLRRRCRRLTCELEDARVLAESQQSRNHELEKRQKK